MKKYRYSWISTAVLVLVGLTVTVTGGTAAQSTDFVNVNLDDIEGSGTADNPYIISNASELQAINHNPDAHYELGDDINASGTAEWNGGSGFRIIEYFTGHFDGRRHKISGLSVDRKDTSSVGLFSEIHDATVENVHITNSSISGRNDVGILAGSNSEGGVIREVSTGGTVVGADNVGGLIGYNIDSGVVTQSSSSADITVSPADRDTPRAGGLVGGNYDGATINRSYATGDVDGVGRAGGLLGENFNNSRVAYTYSAGDVSGSETGGLVGGNYRESTVIASYWDMKATGQSISAGSALGLKTSEMTGSAAETNMEEFAFGSVWQAQTDSYPTLITPSSEGGDSEGKNNKNSTTGFVDVDASDLAGSGTISDPYVITNASELQAMEDDLDANYTLNNYIDASGTARWNGGNGFDPVGEAPFSDNEFTGSLNGSDYTISNLVINRPKESYVGLFGSILPPSFSTDTQAVITHLAVSNISITGDDYVGGVVGSNLGRINNSYVTGSVSGNNSVGGLTGENMGEFNNGIVATSYAAVSVDGSNAVGGLSGDTWNGAPDPQSSYWDINISGQQASAGGVGLTTDEMTGSTAQSNMSGLNFDTVWNTQSGGYPILAQQADDKSNQSDSAQVQLSKISLTPQSVDLDSVSTHKLIFDAYNVSNDGEKDEFKIEFPNKLNLIDSSNVTVSGMSSTPQVNITENTLRFTVNPNGTQSNRTLTVKMVITLSASDTTEERNTSNSQLPIPSDAEKVELSAQEREGLRNSLERGGEIDVENISELSVYRSNLQRDRESGGFVWFQNHKNVSQWEQSGTTGSEVRYTKEDTVLYIGFFDGSQYDEVQNPKDYYFYTIKGPRYGLFL